MSMAALEYLRGGYHLLALTGKRPNPRFHAEWSWDRSFHGDPTGHEAQIDEAFDFFFSGTTGIAILIPPNVLVADIDSEEAAQLFSDLAGTPKDTAIARTTKGLHVWYVAPGANGSRWLGDRTLLFKGFGGYVAVEPSKHFTDDSLREQDGTYTWVEPLTRGFDFLPDGIAAMFKAADEMMALLPRPDFEGSMGRAELQLDDEGRWTGIAWHVWDLDGLVKAIETAADGNQNNVIHWAACCARDGGVPYEVSMDVLLAAALRGKHPRQRAVSTIRGAYKRRRG